MAIPIPFLIFLFLFTIPSHASNSPRTSLTRGSSISIQHQQDILVSPKKTFTFGFHGTGGNAYYIAVWFTGSRDRTAVWMGNRDKPVNGKGSSLTFRKNGALVLTDVDGSISWETNTTSTDAHEVKLLETGNLVIRNRLGRVLWQSFDNPTDTLLPNQRLTQSRKLVSSMGPGSAFSGYFNFFFDNDNVLRLKYDGPDISSIYWPNPDVTNVFQNGRTNYNSSRIAVLDDSGRFQSSDRFQIDASDRGLGIKRRLTLDHDGNLRLYSLNESNGTWSTSWEAMTTICNIHGICGRNGICVYTPRAKCSCPPGYEMANPKNWNAGCKPKFKSTCSGKVKFVELRNTDYYGFDLVYNSSTSFEWCRNACLADCSCLGFAYRINGDRPCYTKISLFNGYKTPSFPGSIYLKLPESVQASAVVPELNGSDPVCPSGENRVLVGSSDMYDTAGKRIRWVYLYSFAATIGGVEVIFFLFGYWILFRKHGGPELMEEGYQALSSQFRKFSYEELKTAARNFRDEIGRGGSGIVYKGKLGDGREVAIKRLEETYHGEEFFWAEVSTIGKINHMNLARMWGFCAEGRNRLLVYEFVENKSLDKHLFGPGECLAWKDRFKIAVGTARGLAYLHHECLEWVIHCDVKPENILIDAENEPKIADFGLAKLLQRGNLGGSDGVTRVRGTKGYMAPEWALNLPITAKVDVFSFGVMVLEIVRGARVSSWVMEENEGEPEEEAPELVKFVRLVRRKVLEGSGVDGGSWIEEFVDPRLKGKYSRGQARAMVEVGMACVEEDRNKRPTMDNVVHLLMQYDNQQKDKDVVD